MRARTPGGAGALPVAASAVLFYENRHNKVTARPTGKRKRLDQLLAERGLASSRASAQRLVLAGKVRVDGMLVTRPGQSIATDSRLEVTEPERYVSRGGWKLEAALAGLGIDVRGKICLDVGASTGGFTDCLLQQGARRVYAVDVGKGQLHWKLRQDPRVVVKEGINARYLQPSDIPEVPEVATVDVSFISLTLVLGPVTQVVAPGGVVVALIKPQFEAGRDQVGRGGVVRDDRVRQQVREKIRTWAREQLGLEELGWIESPLKGPAGNVEFLVAWKKPLRSSA